MKVEKEIAVALMVALGFVKAEEWDDEKLRNRLAQVPAKVEPDAVPENFQTLYQRLKESEGEEVDLGTDGVLDMESMDKRALKTLIEERGLSIKGWAKLDLPTLRKKVAKALTVQEPPKEEAPKPERERPDRKDKVVAKAARRADTGTNMKTDLHQSVLDFLTSEWKTMAQMEAGLKKLPLRKIRRAVRQLAKAGKLKRERLVRWRTV
jgi:hypothetical protein